MSLQQYLHKVTCLRMSHWLLMKSACNLKTLSARVSFSSAPPRLPLLTLYTKHPCPLCDDAKEELTMYKEMFMLEEVDITEPSNKEWFKKYRYDIPVFHFEGKFLMKHRVDLDALKEALKNYQDNDCAQGK